MAKRSRNTDSSAPRSIIATLITAIVLVIAVAIGGITGVDVLSLLGLTTPVATAVVTVAPPGTEVANVPGNVTTLNVGQGFGAQKGFWQVFFTAPTGSRDTSTYVNGIEMQLAAAIDQLKSGDTLDIAAYEFNLPALTKAVLDAHRRGVRIRMVTDTQHGLEDDDSTVPQLVAAGIPVVDDKRTAFMHNKFMILNGATVWTGSWNFTINDTYRNNNNALALRSRRLAERYQAEFDQMFNNRRFGPNKTPSATTTFTQDGVPIQLYFAPEDRVLQAIVATIGSAQKSVRFLTFSFTDFDVAKAIMDRAAANPNILVQGIFETTGSETQASELRTLRCAGLDARQDSGKSILHHKLFIVDDAIVITGSFNISSNATESNDENLLIIPDPDLAAQYVAEFNRRWAESRAPGGITCN
ncbi:MAG: phospholipase [Chloroflexi bacterium]|nr:phospholipase [Chloroflexota bacterium]